jgi:hypothetical protein
MKNLSSEIAAVEGRLTTVDHHCGVQIETERHTATAWMKPSEISETLDLGLSEWQRSYSGSPTYLATCSSKENNRVLQNYSVCSDLLITIIQYDAYYYVPEEGNPLWCPIPSE